MKPYLLLVPLLLTSCKQVSVREIPCACQPTYELFDIFAVVEPTVFSRAWLDIQPKEQRFFGYDGMTEFAGTLEVTCQKIRFLAENVENDDFKQVLREVTHWSREGLELLLLDEDGVIRLRLKKVD